MMIKVQREDPDPNNNSVHNAFHSLCEPYIVNAAAATLSLSHGFNLLDLLW